MDTIHSDIFPDGTPVDGWFHNTSIPEGKITPEAMIHVILNAA